MRRLSVYNSVSLDGFFVDAKGDMSWAHKRDPEWNTFVAENTQGGAVMTFGRITYDLMAGFWPTEAALQTLPAVAEKMNSAPKVVFSRTLAKASWNNTRLVKGDLVEEVRKMKQEPGDPMVILGSGSIVAQLTDARLIDEYQMVMTPVVLGKGRTMFEGIREKVSLRLMKSRAFSNGSVVLWYELAA